MADSSYLRHTTTLLWRYLTKFHTPFVCFAFNTNSSLSQTCTVSRFLSFKVEVLLRSSYHSSFAFFKKSPVISCSRLPVCVSEQNEGCEDVSDCPMTCQKTEAPPQVSQKDLNEPESFPRAEAGQGRCAETSRSKQRGHGDHLPCIPRTLRTQMPRWQVGFTVTEQKEGAGFWGWGYGGHCWPGRSLSFWICNREGVLEAIWEHQKTRLALS